MNSSSNGNKNKPNELLLNYIGDEIDLSALESLFAELFRDVENAALTGAEHESDTL